MSSVSNSACHEQCHHDSGTVKHHINMDTDLHDEDASLFQADKENLHVLLYEECLGKVLLETHKPPNYFYPALNTMQSVCQKIFICGLVNSPHFHFGLRVWSILSSILIFAFFGKWSKFTEEKSKEEKKYILLSKYNESDMSCLWKSSFVNVCYYGSPADRM